MGEYEKSRDQLVWDIKRALSAADLKRDDMVVTDAVVIVTQRGFDGDSGTSLTVTLVPSDTPTPMVLGMLQVATIEHTQHVVDLYKILNRPEDDDV